jgi:hypothetical protein
VVLHVLPWPRPRVAVAALDDHLVARPDPEREPSAYRGLCGEGLRGERQRVVRPGQRDRRTEPDPRRTVADRGDQGERVPAGPLPEPGPREPEPGRLLDIRDDGGQRPVVLDPHTDLHVSTPAPDRAAINEQLACAEITDRD